MTGIFELSIIVCLAAFLSIIAKIIKQPLILAYIGTGIMVGFIQRSFNFFNFGGEGLFYIFYDLGIMFLLFLIGLEMNYSSLRTVGKTSVFVGLGQIIFTFVFGFIISKFLGFSLIHSSYISIALTFSSTIIIVKLISDKKSLNSLYGKISVGFLLVQDFVVILILIMLSGLGSGGDIIFLRLLYTILSGIFLFGLMIFIGRKIIPSLLNKISESQELLFLISIAWVFSLVVIIDLFEKMSGVGFSIEIAGFLAGLALANSSEHFQIANRIKPLRDFFVLIFFIMIGSSIVLYNFGSLIFPILAFSIFVLIGNPFIVMLIMGLMGYRKRTFFMSGITVAQISEFSLVLATIGVRLGHIDESILTIIAAVGIITIIGSTYMIVHSDVIFSILSPYLSIFERKNSREDFSHEEFKKPIILIGYDRTGKSIASSLNKKDLLIIDFNPTIIKSLESNGYKSIYGDVGDPLIFDNIDFTKSKMIISTNPRMKDNISLIKKVRSINKNIGLIFRAESGEDAIALYDIGADYVFVPLYFSGQYLGKIIKSKNGLKKILELKERDIDFIKKLTKK